MASQILQGSSEKLIGCLFRLKRSLFFLVDISFDFEIFFEGYGFYCGGIRNIWLQNWTVNATSAVIVLTWHFLGGKLFSDTLDDIQRSTIKRVKPFYFYTPFQNRLICYGWYGLWMVGPSTSCIRWAESVGLPTLCGEKALWHRKCQDALLSLI